MRHTIMIKDKEISNIYFTDENGFVMEIKLANEKMAVDLQKILDFFKPTCELEEKQCFSIDEPSKNSVKIVGNIDHALKMLGDLKLFGPKIIFQIRTDAKLKDFIANSKTIKELREEKANKTEYKEYKLII